MYNSIWQRNNNRDYIDPFDLARNKLPIERIVKFYHRGSKELPKRPAGQPIHAPFRRRLLGTRSQQYPDFNENIRLGGTIGNRKVETIQDRSETRFSIPAGKKIGEAKAFASVVDRTEHSYCISCKSRTEINHKCIKCGLVLFCSQTCRDKNRAHDFECGTNFHCIGFGDYLDIKLAIQMVFESLVIHGNAVNLMQAVNQLVGDYCQIDRDIPRYIANQKDRFKCIMKLHTIYEADCRDSCFEEKTLSAYTIISQYEKIATCFDGDWNFLKNLLGHFIKVINANAFKLSDEGLDIAMIFDSMSFLNHSCSPNALNFIINDKMLLISSRPIGPSTEICISYVPSFFDARMHRDMRRERLARWGFKCKCARCKSREEIPEKYIKDRSRLTVRAYYNLEKRINKNIESNATWTTEIGAYCINYFNACMASLIRLDNRRI